MHGESPIKRRESRKIWVGNVPVGGDAPIAVQSMTNSDTNDVAATVAQINRLEAAGVDIVRVSVPDMDAAEAFGRIKQLVKVPLVADIHFDYKLALQVLAGGIDGLRLDVAYCLDENFVRRLRSFCDSLKPDFFLVGEMLHGDYNRLMNDSMLHSATNYECYKGLYSSFNSMNMFEIVHSLLRQFGPENWTLYKGKHLLSFVDNHDVTRVASILTNEKHLPLIYALMFGMPGIPCVYYGSEWGAKGEKSQGDPALRACFDGPQTNGLTEWIAKLAEAKKHSNALNYGAFRSVVLTNRQCIFERAVDGERVLVAINAEEQPYTAHFDAGCGRAVDLITGEKHDFGGGSLLPAYSAYFWLMEN